MVTYFINSAEIYMDVYPIHFVAIVQPAPFVTVLSSILIVTPWNNISDPDMLLYSSVLSLCKFY